MLTIKDLSYRHVLTNVQLSLAKGKLYALLGRNGSGKSSLLKTISRIWQPDGGRITWEGVCLGSLSRLEVSKIVTLVPQGQSASFPYTVEQFVSMGRYPLKTAIDSTPYLESVDLLPLQHRRLDELSQGEKQRVYIARGLATKAPLLLLDEPTAHLDQEGQKNLWILLKRLAMQGRTLLVATHDVVYAQDYAEHLLEMKMGRVVEASFHKKRLIYKNSLHKLSRRVAILQDKCNR